jgi:hypothetical protein
LAVDRWIVQDKLNCNRREAPLPPANAYALQTGKRADPQRSGCQRHNQGDDET